MQFVCLSNPALCKQDCAKPGLIFLKFGGRVRNRSTKNSSNFGMVNWWLAEFTFAFGDIAEYDILP